MGDASKFLGQIYANTDVSNCSGFLKEVAEQLDILGDGKPIPNEQANPIIDYICLHPESWLEVGVGATDALKAATQASKGFLVVALLKGADHADHRLHGHVAIVLPLPMLEDNPRVICAGAASGRSDGTKAVYASNYRGVWKRVDAPNVQYYQTKQAFPALTP